MRKVREIVGTDFGEESEAVREIWKRGCCHGWERSSGCWLAERTGEWGVTVGEGKGKWRLRLRQLE